MPIQPTTPIVIPATPEKVADAMWLQNLIITAPAPDKPATVKAILYPYVSTTGELIADADKVNLVLDDVLTLAETQTELANCINVIFAEVERQCKLKNLI